MWIFQADFDFYHCSRFWFISLLHGFKNFICNLFRNCISLYLISYLVFGNCFLMCSYFDHSLRSERLWVCITFSIYDLFIFRVIVYHFYIWCFIPPSTYTDENDLVSLGSQPRYNRDSTQIDLTRLTWQDMTTTWLDFTTTLTTFTRENHRFTIPFNPRIYFGTHTKHILP